MLAGVGSKVSDYPWPAFSLRLNTDLSGACAQALAPGGTTELNAATLEAIAEEAPSARLAKGEVVGSSLIDVLLATKMQPSKSAGRRLIQVLHRVLTPRSLAKAAIQPLNPRSRPSNTSCHFCLMPLL